MTRLLEILISLAIVAALLLLVSLVLPSERNLQEKVETNRKMTIVYDTLNSLRRFKTWNALTLRDPKVDISLSGPESGVGAQLDYTSTVPEIGKGSWKLTKTVPNESVDFALDNAQRGTDKRVRFELKPSGRGIVKRNVEITQTYHVDYGWDLIGRYAGLYVSRNVGEDMKLGMQRLANMLASVPNVDYKVAGSKLAGLKMVERPAEDLLVVPAGSIERNNETIKASMKSNMEWITRTMAASGLSAAGPMRIVSTELGRDTYTFEVVQPVRRGGAAVAATDTEEAGAEGEETAPAAPVEPVAAGSAPMTGIKLQGPVTYVRSDAGRAATATYTGYMAELENVRNAVRAWAVTQGYEATDRPYEVYKNGIDNAFTENGEYEVYWKLK